MHGTGLRDLMSKNGPVSSLSAVISIGIGLAIGLVMLFFFNASYAMYGFGQILTAGFSSTDKFAKVLYQAAPLIMTGLSVGFAFKTGLFNIGASGQYTVGAFCALVAGIQFQLPWYAAMFCAMIGGAVWGAVPGLCKAYFNVNEVITSIMFNWIGVFFVNLTLSNMPMMLSDFWGASTRDRTATLGSANPDAIIPKLGLDKVFDSSYINISIIIAIIIAVIIWVVLSKTTFGYELKACGHNRNASVYAGINAKRNIVLSMLIAGALSGIGGGIYYLSGTAQYTITKTLLPMGFNGIPVALLATSNPVGIIFSALFVSYIQVGGDAMQPHFVREIIDIIIAVIIYLSAFSLLVKTLISKRIKPRKESVQAEASAGAGIGRQPANESEGIKR